MPLPTPTSACYCEEDPCSNPRVERPIGDLISRRDALRFAATGLATTWLGNIGQAKDAITTRPSPKDNPSHIDI